MNEHTEITDHTETHEHTEMVTTDPGEHPGGFTDPWALTCSPSSGRDSDGHIRDPWADSETRPWDPLPGESGVDYQRFGYYRRLKRTRTNKRSLTTAYANERRDKLGPEYDQRDVQHTTPRVAPPTWYRARDRYHWDERCRLWDLHNETQLLLAEERELEIARRERREALHALLAKCMEAIPNLDLSKVTLAQVSRAVQVSVQELRKEYGDDSTPGTIQLEALISTIPADFRSEVIIALRARSGAPSAHAPTDHRLGPRVIEGEVIPK